MNYEGYITVGTIEVKTDVYSGDNSDEHENYLECKFDGDVGETKDSAFLLLPENFPAGTIITIKVPCCPDCGLDAEYQDSNKLCECGFDWKVWTENKYS